MLRGLINIFYKLTGNYYYKKGEELPEEIDAKEIFIAGNLEDNWVVIMMCPCGCGDKIYLNTLETEKPSWKISYGIKGISISPSIARTKKCRSHFFLINGKIIWSHAL